MRDICQHIMDLVQNSVEAQAGRVEILLQEDLKRDLLCLEIRDDGRGLSAEALRRVTDPFYTTRKTRRVGLGLSLLNEAAKRTGGDITITSAPDQGTIVRCSFTLSHLDLQPMGDVPQTVIALIVLYPKLDLSIEFRRGEASWGIDFAALREQLGADLPLSEPAVMTAIKRDVKREWSAFQEALCKHAAESKV